MSIKFPLKNYKEYREGFPEDVIPHRFCIYKITNIINNKFYIGKHSYGLSPFDDYSGGGILLNRAYEKYGVEHFEKEILEYNIRESEINDLEKFYIKKYRDLYPDLCYNIASGGDGGITYVGVNPHKGWKPSKETRERMSKGRMGVEPWNKGIKYPPELCKKIAEAVAKSEKNTHKYTEEYKEKCRQSHINSPNNKGKTHYAYGKIYINNGETQRLICKGDEIPLGWTKGTLPKKNIYSGVKRSPEDLKNIQIGRLLKMSVSGLIQLYNPEETRSWKNLRLKEEYNISDEEINNYVLFSFIKKYFLPKVLKKNMYFLYSDFYRFCRDNNLYTGPIQRFHPWQEQNRSIIEEYIKNVGCSIPGYLKKDISDDLLFEFLRNKNHRILFQEIIDFIEINYGDFIDKNIFEEEKNKIKDLLLKDYAAMWISYKDKNRTINRENL